MSKKPPNFRGKLLSDIHFFGQLSNAKATTNDLLNLIFCQNSLSLPLENTKKKNNFLISSEMGYRKFSRILTF